jgi:hypothetical protein
MFSPEAVVHVRSAAPEQGVTPPPPLCVKSIRSTPTGVPRPSHIERGSGPVKPQSDVAHALASEALRKVQRPASWPARIQNSDFNGRFDKVAQPQRGPRSQLAVSRHSPPHCGIVIQPCGRTWARAQALPPSFSPCRMCLKAARARGRCLASCKGAEQEKRTVSATNWRWP